MNLERELERIWRACELQEQELANEDDGGEPLDLTNEEATPLGEIAQIKR